MTDKTNCLITSYANVKLHLCSLKTVKQSSRISISLYRGYHTIFFVCNYTKLFDNDNDVSCFKYKIWKISHPQASSPVWLVYSIVNLWPAQCHGYLGVAGLKCPPPHTSSLSRWVLPPTVSIQLHHDVTETTIDTWPQPVTTFAVTLAFAVCLYCHSAPIGSIPNVSFL